MDISVSELFYLMAKRYTLVAPTRDTPDARISYAQAWRGQSIKPGVLYIAEATHAASLDAADAVILTQAAGPHPSAIVYQGSSSAERLAEAASAAIIDLQTWDIRLKDASLEGVSVEELLGIGHDIISELTDITDFEFGRLYRTPGLPDAPMGGNAFPLDEHDSEWSSDRAMRILGIDDYAKTNTETDAFFYPFDIDKAIYVCGNIFGENKKARLIALCPPGFPRLARIGLRTIFSHFLDYLRRTLVANWQNDSRATIYYYLRKTLLGLTQNPKEASTERIAEAAGALNWNATDAFEVFVVKLFKGPNWELLIDYKRSQIEVSIPGSIAVRNGDEVVCFCNVSNYTELKEIPLKKRIRHIVQDLACSVGISRRLNGIALLPSGVRQARIALDVGGRKNPHFWIHYFSDYVRDYLYETVTAEMPVAQIIHPGLQQLIAYDHEYKTDYFETLRRYFDCEYNVAKAAEEMYLHRTTFSRRISKINEIAGFDPRDSQTRLDLAISFWLLGYRAG